MSRRQAPKGTEDLLPSRILRVEHVFGAFRRVAEAAGYREIRTPIFEDTGLFVRSLGEVSDVVEKEMFTIQRDDYTLTLRPEGTAPVARAYLEHSLDKVRPLQKLYYAGPMFRAENPQKGRQRQFYQCGIEALGSTSPLLDADVLGVAMRAFAAMGLRNYELRINSIGDRGDRERFREILRQHMAAHLPERCADCLRRFERNVFRMLDCKVAGCQPSNRSAPHFLDHIGAESRARFDATLAALTRIGIPFTVDPAIVRGFDYYTHTVYEIVCPDVGGTRTAICGGGRYDTLLPDLGGPDLGATGFAIGVTPTLLALAKQRHPSATLEADVPPIFVAPVADEQRLEAFALADRLRGAGLSAETDFEGKSLRALFKAADKRGYRLLLMIGPDEIAAGTVKLKDLHSGAEIVLPNDHTLGAVLGERLAVPGDRLAVSDGAPADG